MRSRRRHAKWALDARWVCKEEGGKERERERERKSVCEREKERASERASERARVCVYREREGESWRGQSLPAI